MIIWEALAIIQSFAGLAAAAAPMMPGRHSRPGRASEMLIEGHVRAIVSPRCGVGFWQHAVETSACQGRPEHTAHRTAIGPTAGPPC